MHSYLFRVNSLEMDSDAYLAFLVKHHAELNLPYSFATKLSFLSSPLVLGKVLMVFHEDSYEMVGAAGFVYGTSANQYEDKHICQLEVAFLQKAHRQTSLFVQSLKVLIHTIDTDNPHVTQVQFWTAADQGALTGLFSKFEILPGSTKSNKNNLAFYTIPYAELKAYALALR